MAQSIAGVLTNLHAACVALYATTLGSDGQPVLVSPGQPGQYQPHAILAVGMELRLPITRPTMGTGRSREQTAEIDVVASVYVAGGDEAQSTANAAALALQAQLETYLRTSPNETLSGACRDSYVSNARLEPAVAWQQLDGPNSTPVAAGRVATNTITVTALIRY